MRGFVERDLLVCLSWAEGWWVVLLEAGRGRLRVGGGCSGGPGAGKRGGAWAVDCVVGMEECLAWEARS